MRVKERFLPTRGRLPKTTVLPACRWCKGCIPKGRRTFCSSECVHEWKLRSSSSYVRKCLLERDNAICKHCGCDCQAVEAGQKLLVKNFLRNSGILAHVKVRTYWEAHHIVPVHAGGGQCGLDNYQTVCRVCHVRLHPSGSKGKK